jgi:alanine-glyoxylate transaminase / serine-glyoxylate transaminase / serine-pyruvate transaminase
LTVPVGAAPDLARVEEELRGSKKYAALVATHVETSTAVLTQLPPLQALLRKYSPSTLFVVDAVASLVAEELRFDDWSIDVVLTGSQKALGCPPGLSIIMTSARALAAAQALVDDSNRPRVWYASLQRWLPIMRTYERKETAYFATPPTQLIRALSQSLDEILAIGMEETWRLHREKSTLVKSSLTNLGLTQLATVPEEQANALTAFWMPQGVDAKDLLKRVHAKGVMLSGGMHKEVGSRYLRFGHMGYSATSDRGDIQIGLATLTEALVECFSEQTVAQEERLHNAASLETASRAVQVADG